MEKAIKENPAPPKITAGDPNTRLTTMTDITDLGPVVKSLSGEGRRGSSFISEPESSVAARSVSSEFHHFSSIEISFLFRCLLSLFEGREICSYVR